MSALLIDVKRKLEMQDIFRGSTVRALVAEIETLATQRDGYQATVVKQRAELAAKDEALKDAEKLRRNVARYFASAYRVDPVFVAEICDEQIDRTGTLLGYVREEAAALKAQS